MNCAVLPVVVRPLDDEGLGSWIGRIAAYYRVPTQTLLKHIGIVRTDIRAGSWLTQSGLHAPAFLALAQTLRCWTSTLSSMVTSPWCLPCHVELGMCVQCVMESFRSDQPMYWRRCWLDAVTIRCLKHATWLTPVDPAIFQKSANRLGVEQRLLIIAEHEANVPSSLKSPCLADCINMSALHLQSLFGVEPSDQIARLRYGLATAGDVRRVTQDLLDVLLAAETSRPDHSLLAEFTLLQKIPIALHTVAFIPRQTSAMRIRQVRTLDARIIAMAMTDSLMFASARIDELQLRTTTFDARSMRTHWLWPLIPPASLNLLVERSKNWPLNYLRSCWPELDNIDRVPMLQRRKNLIAQRANRDNPPTLHHSLANIRAN